MLRIETETFHNLRVHAPIDMVGLLIACKSDGVQVSVYPKQRGQRFGIFVRPEDKNGNVLPSYAYTYPYEIFFSDGEKTFRPGQGRGIVGFVNCSYEAEYDTKNNGPMIIWTERTRREINHFLKRNHIDRSALTIRH